MKYDIEVYITGMGWVTPAGMGCGRDHTEFTLKTGPLPPITLEGVFEKSDPFFRRMDTYSKLGIAAILFALKDASLDKWINKRNMGVIASTIYGCLNTDADYFDTVLSLAGPMASPALFSRTLASSFIGEAAIRFGLTGVGYVISDPVPSGLSGLQDALAIIQMGEAVQMLCGICDEGPPSFFNNPGIQISGSLFFVLERYLRDGIFSYGGLNRNSNGRILFNGIEIRDLFQLARLSMAVGK